MNLLLKTLPTGAIKNTGIGQQVPIEEKKASFLSENILPLQESGQLKFVGDPKGYFSTANELDFGIFFADGHTEKQMIPHMNYKGKKIVFMADLLPTAGHLPVPFVMDMIQDLY